MNIDTYNKLLAILLRMEELVDEAILKLETLEYEEMSNKHD